MILVSDENFVSSIRHVEFKLVAWLDRVLMPYCDFECLEKKLVFFILNIKISIVVLVDYFCKVSMNYDGPIENIVP